MDIPTTEPREIRAGDTWKWRREDLTSDYPASEYTLKYYLKNAAKNIEITAEADGDDFAVTVTAAATGAYTAGTYSWVAYAEKSTGETLERYQVDSGTLEVLKAFADSEAYDNRSHVKKVLDSIEAAIEGRATSTELEYSISGRTIRKMNPEELIKWHSHYKTLYRQEQNAEKIRKGLGTGRKVLTRFK